MKLLRNLITSLAGILNVNFTLVVFFLFLVWKQMRRKKEINHLVVKCRTACRHFLFCWFVLVVTSSDLLAGQTVVPLTATDVN